MKNYVEFNNNRRMPSIGLGFCQIGEGESIDENTIKRALDAGYRRFDASVLHANEEALGHALHKHLRSGLINREDIFIVTKLSWIGMHPGRVSQCLITSLKKLQLDYIDLYLIDWPIGVKYSHEEKLLPTSEEGKVLIDTSTNLEATWRAMEFQVDSGRTKSIGISNFNPLQIERIMNIAKIPPANHQFEIHAHFQNRDWITASQKYNISITAYGPYAGPTTDVVDLELPSVGTVVKLIDDPVAVEISNKHGKTPSQILLKFLLQLGYAVIPSGPVSDCLQLNINDIFQIELSSEEMNKLTKIDKGEAGRSFRVLPGIDDHPEFPF